MASISIRKVSKIYDERVTAVNDISLEISDSEFLAFLGPSGCGKTSTLRMIAGLETISNGEIFFDNERINEKPSNQRNVAMAFENYGLYPHMTVYENISYPLKLRKLSQDQISNKVITLVRILKIEEFLDDKPSELSGGIQQRVSLARALVRDPSVLLLDEPISHLDADLRSQMRGELKRLHSLNQTTTIYVTHDQLEAMTMADRIAVMSDGKIQQVGTPKDIYYHPENLFVATFVGEPPMNIIDGKLINQNGHIQLLLGNLVIFTQTEDKSPELLEEIAMNSGQVKIGIRPLDFNSVSNSKPGIKTSIRLMENLGEKILYHLSSDVGPILYLTSNQNSYVEGGNLRIFPNTERIHLFSVSTGDVINIKS